MSASWPPDYKNYENLSNDEVVEAIISESQNKKAPSNYTQFFEQIAAILESQNELLKKQKTLNESNAHCMKTVETNYHSLTALYEEEHGRCLDLEQQHIDDKVKHDNAIQQLQMQLAEKLNLEKQDHNKTKEKQAIMRMKMEQELVKSMRDTEELKQKLREAEMKTASLEKVIADRNQYQLLQQHHQPQQLQQLQHDKNAQIPAATTNNNSSNTDVDFFIRYFGNSNQ